MVKGQKNAADGLFGAFVDFKLVHIPTVMGIGIVNYGTVAGGGNIIKAKHGTAGLYLQQLNILGSGCFGGNNGSGIINSGFRP